MLADRLPPHDIRAEESVIASLLIDGETLGQVSSFLLPDDFYRERNRWCYEAVLELFNRGEAINQVTVAHELESANQIEQVGGSAFLAHVISAVPTSVHIEHYGRLVHRTATMRRLIAAADDIADIGYEDSPDIDNALSAAENVLFSIRSGQASRDFTPLREVFDTYLENDPSLADPTDLSNQPVMSGFRDLDRLLGGLQRSDMLVLAARPSIGKSTVALNIARNAAATGMIIGIFSLEMGREQVALRLLSAESQVDTHRLRMRLTGETEDARIADAIGHLSDLPIWVDDTPLQTVVEIRSKARRLSMEHGLDMVIVDYMQLIEGRSSRGDANRVQEVSEISRSMKGLARDLNIPVVAISQLSRAIEQRTQHRPQLSDLRDSGSIEQDADVVMFIHREDKYTDEDEWARTNPGQPYPHNLAEIIVAKHRHGPTDSVMLAVQDNFARFVDAARLTASTPERV